jgi:hypothetical protein
VLVGLEAHVELAFLDALVQPGGAEDEPPQPVDQRAVAGADELGPAVVDVLAQCAGRVLDLAIDGEVHQVLELRVVQAAAHEPELQRGLLAALAEITLVERESQLSVFQDEVVPGVVISAARGLHEAAVAILSANPPRPGLMKWDLHG